MVSELIVDALYPFLGMWVLPCSWQPSCALSFSLLEYFWAVPVRSLWTAAGAKWQLGDSVLGVYLALPMVPKAASLQGSNMCPLDVFWVSLTLIWVQVASVQACFKTPPSWATGSATVDVPKGSFSSSLQSSSWCFLMVILVATHCAWFED